jgi:uncharacterized membrane protein
VALVAILLIATGVRLVHLFQPLRYDEAYTYLHFAAVPLATGLADYSRPNNHLLHTLFVHASTRAFGSEPWALRLPAFIAGVLIVPMVYAVGRLMADRSAALVAAAFAAASAPLILYSTNARGYTLLTLISLVLVAVAWRVRQSPTAHRWAALIAVAVLGFYTIPVMLYPAGAVFLWLKWVLERDAPDRATRAHVKRVILRAVLATGGLTALLYLPAIVHSGPLKIIGNRFVVPRSPNSFWSDMPRFASELVGSWVAGYPWWAWALLALGIGGAFLRAMQGKPDRWMSFVAIAGFWCVAVLFVNHRVPFVRVWLFLLPLALIVAARGLTQMARSVARQIEWSAPALALVLSYSVFQSRAVLDADDTGTLREAPEIAGFLRSELRAGDALWMQAPSDAPLEYYMRREGLSSELSRATPSPVRVIVVVNDRHQQRLTALLESHSTLVSRYERPRLIRRFSGATIYLLQPAPRRTRPA